MSQAIKEAPNDTCSLCLPAWTIERFGSPLATDRLRTCGEKVLGGVGAPIHDGPNRWVSACVEIPDIDSLDASQLREVSRRSMGWLRETLTRCDARHPIRFWNFLPGIHELIADPAFTTIDAFDRYRAFNLGRYDAFCEWFGGPNAFAAALPTATGIGHSGTSLRIFAIGSNLQGLPVDNPRQTPAFAYSDRFGPRPPCFARATRARLPDGDFLLVGGTASVRGEDSVHDLSIERQWSEILVNLDLLFSHAKRAGTFDWTGVEHARAYVRCGEHVQFVNGALESALPGEAVRDLITAQICRSELLVEVELLVAETPRA